MNQDVKDFIDDLNKDGFVPPEKQLELTAEAALLYVRLFSQTAHFIRRLYEALERNEPNEAIEYLEHLAECPNCSKLLAEWRKEYNLIHDFGTTRNLT